MDLKRGWYGFLLVSLPFFCSALELETKNYLVTIRSECVEGEVECSKYFYTGTQKSNGATITLRGSSWHTTCADGVTPCRFLGYWFKNGDVIYYVRQDGLLEVVKGDEQLLLSEQGRWK